MCWDEKKDFRNEKKSIKVLWAFVVDEEEFVVDVVDVVVGVCLFAAAAAAITAAPNGLADFPALFPPPPPPPPNPANALDMSPAAAELEDEEAEFVAVVEALLALFVLESADSFQFKGCGTKERLHICLPID